MRLQAPCYELRLTTGKELLEIKCAGFYVLFSAQKLNILNVFFSFLYMDSTYHITQEIPLHYTLSTLNAFYRRTSSLVRHSYIFYFFFFFEALNWLKE